MTQVTRISNRNMETYCNSNGQDKHILTFSRLNIRFYDSNIDREPIFDSIKLILNENYYHHTHAGSFSSLNQLLSNETDLLIFNGSRPQDQVALDNIKATYPELPIFLLYSPYSTPEERQESLLQLCDGSARIPLNFHPTIVKRDLLTILNTAQIKRNLLKGGTYALS